MSSKRLFLLTMVATAALSVGCGGQTAQRSQPEAGHVHGLGVNPADGALFVATHAGMFRLAPGTNELRRVGDRLQDTMGFTVVGPDHFLGSGHPDFYKDEDLPPLLGLIESKDGGKTWTPRSLLGEADFHVLRAAGEHVAGYDVANERLLLSRDGGKTWRQRPFGKPLVDLVIDPANPRTLLAASQTQLFISRDSGQRWRPVTEGTGLLAWPDARGLYLLAADGRVWHSADQGRRWQPRGSITGRPAAFLATRTGRLYAALRTGALKESSDGGRSWKLRAEFG
jgi:hypothetical protein